MSVTKPKERPILMSGLMVWAILVRRKTMTRRVIPWTDPEHHMPWRVGGAHWQDGDEMLPCRYGKVGDRLWVRETWGLLDTQPEDGPRHATIGYRADGDDEAPNGRHQLWRPSIFMPRWACRIVLEITEVRVERLQQITEADARLEGITTVFPLNPTCGEFRLLWEKLNAKRGFGWDANPWVWVITFKRLENP